MAPETVPIDDLTALGGKTDARRVIACRFMDQVIDAGAGFIGEFTCDMGDRQMTFRTGKLMMVGQAPLLMDGFHAVAGPAESRIAGLVIGRNGDNRYHQTDDDAQDEYFENR